MARAGADGLNLDTMDSLGPFVVPPSQSKPVPSLRVWVRDGRITCQVLRGGSGGNSEEMPVTEFFAAARQERGFSSNMLGTKNGKGKKRKDKCGEEARVLRRSHQELKENHVFLSTLRNWTEIWRQDFNMPSLSQSLDSTMAFFFCSLPHLAVSFLWNLFICDAIRLEAIAIRFEALLYMCTMQFANLRNTTAQGWLYTLAQCPPVVGCSDTRCIQQPFCRAPQKDRWVMNGKSFFSKLSPRPFLVPNKHQKERTPFAPLVSLQKWIARGSMPHATWHCKTTNMIVDGVSQVGLTPLKVCGRWSTQRSQEILTLDFEWCIMVQCNCLNITVFCWWDLHVCHCLVVVFQD